VQLRERREKDDSAIVAVSGKMLAFVALAAARPGQFCGVPWKQPDPVPNMSLAYFQVFTRHGMRSPIVVFHNHSETKGKGWNCNSQNLVSARILSSPSRNYRYVHQKYDERYVDYGPSCPPGELTIEGMNQHVTLGSNYRRYLNQLQYLPEKFDPRVFYFESSPVDRCIRSAQSFIFGLYPPVNPNEVITISTASRDYTDLSMATGWCADMDAHHAAFSKSDEVKKFAKDHVGPLKPALSALKLTEEWHDMVQLCGWAVAFNCSAESEPPSWLTADAMEECQQVQAFGQIGGYSWNNTRTIWASYFLRHIFRDADEVLASPNDRKFALFSSHDTCLAGILVALGFKWTPELRQPLYASHLSFEYWKDKNNEVWVRFVYVGEPVKLDLFENKTVVKWDEFRSVMDPTLQYCSEMKPLIGGKKVYY
jgi:acid phosphatase